MGIFSKLFGPEPNIEERLEKQYVSFFRMDMGLSQEEATKNVKGLLEGVMENSKKSGTWNLPLNCGDILLVKEKHDDRVQSDLAKKRKEGVKDKDIRWWWNMHDLERMMIMKVDEVFLTDLFIKYRNEEGLSEEDATREVRKHFPIFGNTEDISELSGEDRPLPHELKNRIGKYLKNRKESSSVIYKKESDSVSSFNAFVRREVKNGNI